MRRVCLKSPAIINNSSVMCGPPWTVCWDVEVVLFGLAEQTKDGDSGFILLNLPSATEHWRTASERYRLECANWSKVTLYVCIKRWRRRLLLQERKVRRTKRSKHFEHSRVKWKRPLRNIYIKRRHCCTAVTRHGRTFFCRLLSALNLLEAFYN